MSTLRLTTLSNQAGTSSVPSDTVISGSAKAWVNFNGTGTIAIRAAFNVSSITDNGTGDYTVNFSTALTDANFSTVAGALNTTSNIGTSVSINVVAPTTTTMRMQRIENGALADSSYVNLAFFR